MNPYPCWNHEPRNGDYGAIEVQDGWSRDGRRIMREHQTQWLPVECGHVTATSDPQCTGCRWRDEQ